MSPTKMFLKLIFDLGNILKYIKLSNNMIVNKLFDNHFILLINSYNRQLYFKNIIILLFKIIIFDFRNAVVLHLTQKEPKNSSSDSKVPSYLGSSLNSDSLKSQTPEKTKIQSNGSTNEISTSKNDQKIEDLKILKENSFGIRLINKVEKLSPSAAKYARIGVFGCKV